MSAIDTQISSLCYFFRKIFLFSFSAFLVTLYMNDFLVGLIVGLAVALVLAIVLISRNASQKKESRKEVEKYKNMLQDRMELESDGIVKLKDEIAELKKQNENLRISLNTMAQKPGRKEIQRLDVYQTAAERLIMNSPGFAPVWQAALKESEEEFKKTFLGLTPYLRKHISTKASDAVLIDDSNS